MKKLSIVFAKGFYNCSFNNEGICENKCFKYNLYGEKLYRKYVTGIITAYNLSCHSYVCTYIHKDTIYEIYYKNFSLELDNIIMKNRLGTINFETFDDENKYILVDSILCNYSDDLNKLEITYLDKPYIVE